MSALGDMWSQSQETRSPRGVFALSVLFVFQNFVIDALSQCKKKNLFSFHLFSHLEGKQNYHENPYHFIVYRNFQSTCIRFSWYSYLSIQQ